MLDTLTTILTEAGTQSLGFFNSLQARIIEAKSPGDLVSDADRAVELTIRRLLAQHFPTDGILGEEMGGTPAGRFWAVDPIDGTSNFLSGLPFWTISLGLMDQGEPVAGGIFAPALGLMAVGDRTALRETGLDWTGLRLPLRRAALHWPRPQPALARRRPPCRRGRL
jgi:myo-inositol-1(or 4)-monophosphatase